MGYKEHKNHRNFAPELRKNLFHNLDVVVHLWAIVFLTDSFEFTSLQDSQPSFSATASFVL